MFVLDARFDRIPRTSSPVETVASLVQCSPMSASDVRLGVIAPICPIRAKSAFHPIATVERTVQIGVPHADLAVYSITSSARASRACGTVRPSALAVFRLSASSNLEDWTTGKSDGCSPLRMRPA